jgi:hypothetical protein
VVSLALFALVGGCSAPVRPELPSAPPTSVTVAIPQDGVSLKAVGVTNGPGDAFSLPRDVVISTRVDQPNGVTVVLSSPSAQDIATYLRKTLPTTGFMITADSQSSAAMTFTGYGWQGSFTGTGDSSAVILRP